MEVAAGLSVGVIAYALFGGADFGSGSYDYKLTQSKSWSRYNLGDGGGPVLPRSRRTPGHEREWES